MVEVVFLICFLVFLGVMDSNKAELYAIVVALEMLVPLPRELVVSLVIEYDFVVAISWVLHRERHPWHLRSLFHHLYSVCLPLPYVYFSHVLPEANGIVDSLAEAGMDRSSWYCVSLFT
ncbi:hypothetical protein GQ457_12G011710 [Hibiscus cannabinus]